MVLPKPLESMTEPELAKEIRQRLAYLAKNAPDDASYVFVSYSHKDAEVVYRTVLSWLRAGYNIYLDADFENHSSDTNWVTMMQEKLQERGCQLFVCFFSENYCFSYASVMELLTTRTEQTLNRRDSCPTPKLPIDMILLPNQPKQDGKVFSSDGVRELYTRAHHQALQREPVLWERNPGEETAFLQGLKSFLPENAALDKIRWIKKQYQKNAVNFYPEIANVAAKWCQHYNLNGNLKDLTKDELYRFQDLEITRLVLPDLPADPEPAAPEPADLAALEPAPGPEPAPAEAPAAETPEKPEAPRRRGRPAKGAPRAAAFAELEVAPLDQPPQITSAVTLAQVRARFADPDAAAAFRPVREAMPRGGKGAMDYVMALVLGGCNNITEKSPACKINYYCRDIADMSRKLDAGKLGATWTWSSNCRKLMNQSGSGPIDAGLEEEMRALPETTTLAQLEERVLGAVSALYKTGRNPLVVLALQQLDAFMTGQ